MMEVTLSPYLLNAIASFQNWPNEGHQLPQALINHSLNSSPSKRTNQTLKWVSFSSQQRHQSTLQTDEGLH